MDGIAICDERGMLAYVNAAQARLFGYAESSELIGRSWTVFYRDEEVRRFEAEILPILERDGRWRGEVAGRKADGTSFPEEVSLARLETGGLVWVGHDIMDRKRSEEALRRSEERFRSLIENAPEVIHIVDPEGRILYMNPSVERLLGYRPEEMVGRLAQDFVHPNDVSLAVATFKDDIRHPGTSRRLELRLRHKNGSWRIFEVIGHTLTDDEGNPIGIVNSRDITEHKRADEALRFLADASAVLASSLDSEATLRSLAHLAVASLADFCVIHRLEENGKVRWLEAAHVDPAKEELLRERLQRHPSDLDPENAVAEVLRTGEPALIPALPGSSPEIAAATLEQLRHVNALGTRSRMILPLFARGRTVGAISFSLAESSRQYSPEDLALAEELARRASLAVDNAGLYEAAQQASKAKSDFLSMMSHEFRTPLSAIMGYTDLLKARIGGPITEQQQEQLERIQTSALYLLQMVDEILAFSRMEAGREEVHANRVDAARVAREAAAVVEPLAREKGLGLHLELSDRLPRIDTDPDKLRQILVNLLGNAVKFTENGEIRLAVSSRDGAVEFQVHDTGIGIAAEHQKRIFEPFTRVERVTTRRTGGTGLGLSVVQRLAKLLGGEVRVESTPGRGSTFVLRLPVAHLL